MSDWRSKTLPGAIFVVVFAVYTYTLCPTVYWDDAGELIAACYTLGIPHPPGHPLYAILGKIFTLIPLGSPAYRVNLMSAFFGALTCVVVFQIVRELARKESIAPVQADLAAAVAALGAAFTLLMWDQSVVAETTTLHTFFMMILTLLVFRIDAAGRQDSRLNPRLLALGFLYGLSFTNHVAGLFFAPSLGIILLLGLRKDLFKPARLAAMAALFFLALSLYAYLPLRSRFDPAVDWGNPESLHNFLWVVTAKQYSSNLWQLPTSVGLAYGLRNLAKTLLSNFTILGLFFSFAGAFFLWKKRRAALLYCLLVIAILFFMTLNSAFMSAYLVPAVLLMMIWAGYGIALLQHKTANRSRPLLKWAAPVAAICLVPILFAAHLPHANKRSYRFAEEYGRDLLSSLPQNALLITGSADPLFIGWYLQICEGFRPDIKLITRNGMVRPGYLDQVRRQYPELIIPSEFQADASCAPPTTMDVRGGLPWYANSYFKQLCDLNVSRVPIFWEGSENNQYLLNRFAPYKFVFQILPPDREPSDYPVILLDTEKIVERVGGDPPSARVYANHVLNYGIYYQFHNDPQKALKYYEITLKLNPNETRALNNMGALLAEQGNESEAFAKFAAAFSSNPNDPVSNHNYGQALLISKRVQEAIPFFQRAIKFDPSNFEDHYHLGFCYAALGKNEDAKASFSRALQLNPSSAEALSSLGLIFLRQQNVKEAEPLLKAAATANPANAENWYNLACLDKLKGDSASSLMCLKRALSLDAQKISQLASNDPQMRPLLDSLLQ